MPLPAPEPGLVIHYEFLWRDEFGAGRESGRKARPCVVIVVVVETASQRKTVYVAPITHRRPSNAADGLEIPPRLKHALGLDDQRSWIIVTELNYFDWPGVDVRSLPGKPRRFAYGVLPVKFFETLKQRILRAGRLRPAVHRSD